MLEPTNIREVILTEQAAAAPRQTLLSFCISGRNDDYGGNFKWRIETMLNYLAENVNKLGQLNAVEVLITDWGSDVPLHIVLTLEELARKIVRFIYVPSALARDLESDSEFPHVLANNAAIRRASGQYIAITNSDILFPVAFLRQLFAILNGEHAIRVPREASILLVPQYQVPWWYVNKSPKVDELDFILSRIGNHLPIMPLGSLGPFVPAGFIMMHRDLWYECRGFDERLIYWGFCDADIALRVTKKYPWVDLSQLDMCVFHLEHYPRNNRNALTRKRNPQYWDNPFKVNDDQWGLVAERLQEFVYQDSPTGSSISPTSQGHHSLPLGPKIYQTMGLLLLTVYWHRLTRFVRGWIGNTCAIWLHRAQRLRQEIQSCPLRDSPAVIYRLWLQWRRKRRVK